MFARAFCPLSRFGLFAGALFTLSALPVLSHASTGAHYVALRWQYRCSATVGYAQVQQNAGAFAGTVIELRGRVGGVIGNGSKVAVMLSQADGTAPILDLPANEASLLQSNSTPALRVLARVLPNSSGNVPVLKVLAAAHESEVNTEEARSDARAFAEAESRRLTNAAARRLRRTPRSGNSLVGVSRGGYRRTTVSMPAAPGTLTARAQGLYDRYYIYIASRNPRLAAEQVSQITTHLLNFADRFNVDPRLVVAMVIAESEFNPNSTSRHGAMGLGQLMPETARDLGITNAYDIMQNLGGSISYLKSRLATFGGDGTAEGKYTDEQITLALAAYNAGMGAVKKYGGVPPYRETQAYVKRILRTYHELGG